MTTTSKLASEGIVLFIDQLLVAAGGWIFWFFMSRFASSGEIGEATTISSLVLLAASIAELGLEYPLLKRSQAEKTKILWTATLVELVITFVCIPVIAFVVTNLNEGAVREFVLLSTGLLILSTLGYVTRFALLGVSRVRTILVLDMIGVAIKFIAGYAFLSLGIGVSGLLLSFLLSTLFVTSASIFFARRYFDFQIGNLAYSLQILKDGLVNTPAKLSRVIIVSLGVILLAAFGISSADVGTFYMALMITIVAGGLASSMAFMAIPASSVLKKDLSASSLRIGISLTAPLISALIVAPQFILSIIGAEYVSGYTTLIVLSIAILPYSVVLNAISKFNNSTSSRKVILVGSIEVVVFSIAFVTLVPKGGIFGASLAMLAAFSIATIPSLIWLGKNSARYVIATAISIICGVGAGYLISAVLNIHPVVSIIVSLVACTAAISLLKNISLREIIGIIKLRTNA